MKKILVLIAILLCQITVLMAQSASSDNSTQSVIVESKEKDLINLSDIQKEPNIGMYEYVEQTAKTLSGKEIFIGAILIFIGALMGILFTFFYSKRKIYAILGEEKVYYLDYPPLNNEKSIFHYITLFHVLKRRKDSYKYHNSDLKKQMEELELENIILKKKLENSKDIFTV